MFAHVQGWSQAPVVAAKFLQSSLLLHLPPHVCIGKRFAKGRRFTLIDHSVRVNRMIGFALSETPDEQVSACFLFLMTPLDVNASSIVELIKHFQRSTEF
jgi:hypothetical protein